MLDFELELGPHLFVAAVEIPSPGAGAEGARPLAGRERRALEFQGGRRAATAALTALGAETEVPRADNGCPVWPKGVVGSISHGAGLAVAAVAESARYAGIGIDVERVLTADACDDVRPSVASEAELSLLRENLPELPVEVAVTLIFSCKESLYKCLFPQTGRFMEFAEVQVFGVDSNTRCLWLRLAREFGELAPDGSEFEARFRVEAGVVKTAVVAPRRTHATR